MDGAFRDHPHLAITFDNLRLDLLDLLGHQIAPVLLTTEDSLARFLHTPRAERIGLPRPPQRWLGFLPGFEHRVCRPLRRKRRVWIGFVEKLQGIESHAGGFAYR